MIVRSLRGHAGGWDDSKNGFVRHTQSRVGVRSALGGSAYVYRFDGSTWVQRQKLTASDAAGADRFGWSVSVSRDVAVVGAKGDDCPAGGRDCGAAYVFELDRDSDADAVCDRHDLCPDTPLAAPVNACGCTATDACCAPDGSCAGDVEPAQCGDVGGFYQGDGSICGDGCGFGDQDTDGDVDLLDFTDFAGCFGGQGLGASPACGAFDADGCGPIDLPDYGVFLPNLTGP